MNSLILSLIVSIAPVLIVIMFKLTDIIDLLKEISAKMDQKGE